MSENVAVHPKQSTTVRANRGRKSGASRAPRPLLYALRGAFAGLGSHAPELAATLAERVFRTPPPYRPRPGEEHAVFFADVVPVRFGTRSLAVHTFGEGPTVLLAHGWGGRGTQLRAFIDPLVRAGYRVALFDGPGHDGEARFSQSSLPEMAAALRAVIGALGARAIIAHSMGAAAVVLALERVSADVRLVFVAPPSRLADATRSFGRALALSSRVITSLERRIEERFLRPLSDYDVLRAARAQTAPLLVVHDREDREVPVSSGRAIAQAWPGAELVLTEGLGHVRILRDAAVVERAVEFIAREPRVLERTEHATSLA
ncbi:MAG: alpha/beta fold hydrolase [Polyangiaceae bacterium]